MNRRLSYDVTIRCECAACRTRFRVPEPLAGKKARCPRCQAVFLVPAAAVEAGVTSADSVAPQVDRTADSNEHDRHAQTAVATPADTWPPVLRIEEPPVAARVMRRRPVDWLLWLGGFCLVAACVVTLALLVAWLAARNDPSATLILHMPPEQRAEAALFVDGQRMALPRSGPVEVKLPPGTHKIAVRRRGFDQIDAELKLARRQQFDLQPAWVPLTWEETPSAEAPE